MEDEQVVMKETVPAPQHAKYVKQYRYESDEDFEKVFINSLIYPFNQEAKGEIGRWAGRYDPIA